MNLIYSRGKSQFHKNICIVCLPNVIGILTLAVEFKDQQKYVQHSKSQTCLHLSRILEERKKLS